jgi:hypothetical protein
MREHRVKQHGDLRSIIEVIRQGAHGIVTPEREPHLTMNLHRHFKRHFSRRFTQPLHHGDVTTALAASFQNVISKRQRAAAWELARAIVAFVCSLELVELSRPCQRAAHGAGTERSPRLSAPSNS